ncbi:MAG: TetR/AcrR family transcriptional regulator, partial [Acholeplasmatales bacterium]|nr:TetR/AcrR family transcriptional regulator [Acholeplasmatales bacterium]
MDKRYEQTEIKLKDAFLNSIIETDFDDISIKSLCAVAHINRITYYQHFKDKYELLDSIFRDMDEEALNNLPIRDKINNPEGNPYKKVSNYLYYFVEALNKRLNLVISIASHKAGYIYFSFENFFKSKFKDMLINSGINKQLKYSLVQTISFITGGVINFIVSGV